MSTNDDTMTTGDLATLQAEAAERDRAAEDARAKLAEAAASRSQTVAERRTEWDHRYLDSYDGAELRERMKAADDAFAAALVASDWGEAFVEARKAMWLAIHLTDEAKNIDRQLGGDVRIPVFNYRDPDVVRRLETLIDDEAKRRAGDELAEMHDQRDRYAEGDDTALG
jgi:hypothetical protein